MKKQATELEMIDHCSKYTCKCCPISNKCSMYKKLFGDSNDHLDELTDAVVLKVFELIMRIL